MVNEIYDIFGHGHISLKVPNVKFDFNLCVDCLQFLTQNLTSNKLGCFPKRDLTKPYPKGPRLSILMLGF